MHMIRHTMHDLERVTDSDLKYTKRFKAAWLFAFTGRFIDDAQLGKNI